MQPVVGLIIWFTWKLAYCVTTWKIADVLVWPVSAPPPAPPMQICAEAVQVSPLIVPLPVMFEFPDADDVGLLVLGGLPLPGELPPEEATPLALDVAPAGLEPVPVEVVVLPVDVLALPDRLVMPEFEPAGGVADPVVMPEPTLIEVSFDSLPGVPVGLLPPVELPLPATVFPVAVADPP